MRTWYCMTSQAKNMTDPRQSIIWKEEEYDKLSDREEVTQDFHW